jgi:hypothetical protein
LWRKPRPKLGFGAKERREKKRKKETNKQTNKESSTEQNVSCEADGHFLSNSEVHYRAHKNPPLDSILKQLIQSTSSHIISVRSLLILSSNNVLRFPK